MSFANASTAKAGPAAPAASAAAPPAAKTTEIQKRTCVANFNSCILTLASDLMKRYPKDANIARAHKRIILAAREFPLYIIENIGEYLKSYGKQIYEGDEKFFIENSFDAEIRAGVDPEKIEMVKYIMPMLKSDYQTLEADKRAQYVELVQKMLDIYLDYTS